MRKLKYFKTVIIILNPEILVSEYFRSLLNDLSFEIIFHVGCLTNKYSEIIFRTKISHATVIVTYL